MIKNSILLMFAFLLAFTMPSFAQSGESEEVKVPLSNPGQEGRIFAESHRGSIKIESHSGRDVIVTIIADDDDHEDGRYSGKKGGLKKISAGSFNAEIAEEDNNVYVKAGSQSEVHMIINVPANFAASVKTHHNGDVIVKGLEGIVEVDAHHGDVTVHEIGSSANLNTHHGEIIATFTRVDASKPMAFTTYHGNVDISMPGNASFNTKIKTTKGDIYTDFEMDVKSSANSVKRDKSGRTKIEIGGWRHATIGAGGEELMMSTYHGDIIIRKN